MATAGEIKLLRETFNPLGQAQAQLPNAVAEFGPSGDEGALFLKAPNLKEIVMPYLHLDLPGTYPVEVKRELATRLCKLYADLMETQLWRPNVGIAELGKDNLYRLGSDGLEPITMVMVEFRRGRPAEKPLALGRAIVDVCVELLGVPRRTVMVEFTPHRGEEILRDGNWTGDWTLDEAVTG